MFVHRKVSVIGTRRILLVWMNHRPHILKLRTRICEHYTRSPQREISSANKVKDEAVGNAAAHLDGRMDMVMNAEGEGCVEDLQGYFESVSNSRGEGLEKWKTRWLWQVERARYRPLPARDWNRELPVFRVAGSACGRCGSCV
jgi:hypothetical protein